MPPLRINPRLPKIHRTYTVEEAARLLGVHKNTVRTWLRSGLRPIDGKRPTLISGAELRRFLTAQRAARKRPTPNGMIYCLGCRQPRDPAGQMADYAARSTTSGDLMGICPVCENMLYRRICFAKLDVVRGRIEVTITQAHLRINDCDNPSVNHDFDNHGAPDAESQS